MADQVIQRPSLCRIATQPGVLAIALDQPAPVKQPANTFGDVLNQCLQLGRAWLRNMTEPGRIGGGISQW